MNGWKHLSLNNVVLFQRGFDLPRDNFVNGGIPVYGSTSLLGYHNSAKVKAPGIVTGRSGTLGKFQFIKEDFWPHNTTLWVKDFKGNDEKFIYYLLQCLDFSLFNSGGAVPTLNRNVLDAFKVNLPPIHIQHEIASILFAYDDLIENNTRRIKLLEELAQRTYEEWFVKFTVNGEELQIDEGSGLPEGWKRTKLKEILVLNYGKSLRADNRTEGVFPVYGSSGIIGLHNTCLVKGPAIIIGRKGNVGSVFWSDKDFFPIDTVYYVSSRYSLYFLYFNLQRQNFLNNDAAVPGLNRDAAYSHESFLPSSFILEEFDEIVKPYFGFIEILRNQNCLLKEARDILLPRLMSGEINVEDVPEEKLKRVVEKEVCNQ